MGNVTICGTMPLDNRPALVHTVTDNVKAVGAGDQGRVGRILAIDEILANRRV